MSLSHKLVFCVIIVAILIIPSSISIVKGQYYIESTPSAVTEVYFNYQSSYNTLDYDCWNTNGTSQKWQGTGFLGGYDVVHNAGVIRQGTVVNITGKGASSATIITIKGPKDFSGMRSTIIDWRPRYINNENWQITVPGDAEVGDYKVYMDSTYATLYVIFNIMKWKPDFDQTRWMTWGYDENTTADEYHWMARIPRILGDGHPYSQRVTEFVCSVMGTGIKRETSAVMALSIIAQKRILYGNTLGPSKQDFDTVNLLDGTTTTTYSPIQVTDARLVVEDPTRSFPSTLIVDAYCSHYAALSFGMLKSIGIVTRGIFDSSGTWGWGYHNWVECFIPDTGQSVNGTFNGWLTVDNTRQRHGSGNDLQDNGSPAIDTQPDYAYLSYAFTTSDRPGDYSPGQMCTFAYLGIGTETNYANWCEDDVLPQYQQSDITKAQSNLPTLGNHDVFRGYLDEGDRDFFRVNTNGASGVSLNITKGMQYAQIYTRKETTVAMSPMDSIEKTYYLYDNWGEDSVDIPLVVSTNFVYVMIDNAKGTKFADDYVDGEIRYFEVKVTISSGTAYVFPGKPLSLRAVAVGSAIFLSWGAPITVGGSPLIGYKIFRGTSPGGEGSIPIAIIGSENTTYTDWPPVSGVYYYIVKAANAVLDGFPSNEASANVTVMIIVADTGGFGIFTLTMASGVLVATAISINKRKKF